MSNSDLSEHLITRGSIYDTFFNVALWPEEPYEAQFFRTCWHPKFKKHVETYVFSNMFKICFPGLETLRLAIWTT